jgi:hypothetical protein
MGTTNVRSLGQTGLNAHVARWRFLPTVYFSPQALDDSVRAFAREFLGIGRYDYKMNLY